VQKVFVKKTNFLNAVMRSILLCLCLIIAQQVQAYNTIWKQISNTHVPARGTTYTRAAQYAVYSLDIAYVRSMLALVPASPVQSQVIELPLPDGTYRTFNIWQTATMEPGLAGAFPQIKTFTGVALDNSRVTAKLDITLSGFHAMVFDGDNTTFIDPYSHEDDDYYVVHYKKDEVVPLNERSICQFKGQDENGPAGEAMIINNTKLGRLSKIASGYQLRKYRLALACSNQYAKAATGISAPTKAQVLGAMVTSTNRINGVYEREFSITMVIVASDTNVIFTDGANDPYNAINSNDVSLVIENQKICDSLIGNANYDMGQVFSTFGGGLTNGVVCSAQSKGQCETGFYTPVGDGFDIDYVAHEMGHQFGAQHPFNNGGDGSCGGGNIYAPAAYEPGSGSTIMAYAGICRPDDIQPHSDAYFHAISLTEIYNYTVLGFGNTCAVKAATNNTPAHLDAFSASYNIPYKTPFELTAPLAVDTVADTSNTYCWEQWNLGDVGKRLVNTHLSGPIFRSFAPDTSRTRVFPKIDSILVGVYSYVSTGTGSVYEGREGEKVPDTARFLTFKLTERAIYQGLGSFLFPDDTVHLNVLNTGAAFAITSQNADSVFWGQQTQQTVTWNMVTTNIAPINCDSVHIYMSVDGGHTWPYLLGKYPNTGSAIIVVPGAVQSKTVRIKVKGINNVFFNINSKNIAVDTAVVVRPVLGEVKVYPSPASTIINIATGGAQMSGAVYNVVGQTFYKNDNINGSLSISVAGWARGIYLVQLINKANGQHIVKKVVIQ
jgi:hypothetical protein